MIRIPLVIIGGRVQELPVSDSLAGTGTTEEDVMYSKRIDFITDNELYRGEAAVGSTESTAAWRIRKINIASDNDITEVWASGTAAFDKVWADRLLYTYI